MPVFANNPFCERLCTLVHAPGNQLRELRVANNQLIGVSKFHGGRRNERGLQRLVTAFGSEACALTHLDVSGNGFAAEDASEMLESPRHSLGPRRQIPLAFEPRASQEERESGETFAVCATQLSAGLAGA